jgi:hypothetical protein
MRWTILLCACLLLAISPVPALALDPTVALTSFEVTPAVLKPGDRGLVTVSLANTAQTATKTESSTFGTFPLSSITTTQNINPTIESVFLDGGGDIRVMGGNSQFEGELGPGQTVNLTFLIEAPKMDGIYFPVLRVRVRNAESLIYPIPVNVNVPLARLRTPVLTVVQPPIASIRPGEPHDLLLTLANVGEGAAEDISIRISEQDPAIAPGSTGSFHIPVLDVGESTGVSVSLFTDKEAPEGIHELPLAIEYSLVDGSRAHQSESIGVNIRGQSALVIRSVDTDPVRVSEGDQFDLIVRLENTGTGEAQAIRATIDLPLQGTREAYIGTIQEGNDAPAVFILTANRSGEFTYPFRVSYQDDWGTRTEEHTLQLVVLPSDRLTVLVAVVIVLAVAGGFGLWFWRRKGAS